MRPPSTSSAWPCAAASTGAASTAAPATVVPETIAPPPFEAPRARPGPHRLSPCGIDAQRRALRPPALSRLVLCTALMALPLLTSTGCERAAQPDPSAREVFLRYCASCHGEDGRGHGPLADSLKQPPADLTRLALDHGGDFDERAVMAVIDGRRAVAAHGPRDMPVWGAIFQQEGAEERYPAYQSLLKSRLLVDYLASIQQEAPRMR